MKSVITSLQLTALLLLAVLASAAHAQGASAYQVEVIMFTQPSAPAGGDRRPDYQWADDAVMLESTARSDVRKLDDTLHRLDREADKLQAQGYRILMHKAWLQPADRNLTVAVHDGEKLGEHYPIEAVVGLEQGAEAFVVDVKAWRHTPAADGLVSEQLHQRRQLRLDQVHYLDHQSMGMLVRIARR